MSARTRDTAPTLGSLHKVAVIVAIMQDSSAVHIEILFPEYLSKQVFKADADLFIDFFENSSWSEVIFPKN